MRPGGVPANGDHPVHRDCADFLVDGRPLLFRRSGPEAVSPPGSDVPPAVLTTHVRRLLLEAPREPPVGLTARGGPAAD